MKRAKVCVDGILAGYFSAVLNVQAQTFEVVKKRGAFLLKLPKALYPELPQNEDLYRNRLLHKRCQRLFE